MTSWKASFLGTFAESVARLSVVRIVESFISVESPYVMEESVGRMKFPAAESGGIIVPALPSLVLFGKSLWYMSGRNGNRFCLDGVCFFFYRCCRRFLRSGYRIRHLDKRDMLRFCYRIHRKDSRDRSPQPKNMRGVIREKGVAGLCRKSYFSVAFTSYVSNQPTKIGNLPDIGVSGRCFNNF